MIRVIATVVCWLTASLAFAQGSIDDSTLVQRRNEIREMAYESLVALYEINPSASVAIERAAGYGVFSTFGTKTFFAGGTTGRGVVVNSATKRQTFMNMMRVQAGPGSGAKKDRLVFVFETQQALRDFVQKGWDSGAQAGAAALVAERGGLLSGAVSIAPGVYLYQVTDTGASASITLGSTRFSVDPDLN